jgi:mono/diheme cytochrome c family protein
VPIRWGLVVLLAAASIGVGIPQQQQRSNSSAGGVPDRAVFNQYCVGCHNQKLKTGGLALDTLLAENMNQHPEEWEKVIRKLRPRYMPPAGLPRPDERTYDALIAGIENGLDSVAAAKPNPGRTDTFRRLNRTEYHNAIRDLLAVDLDVTPLLPGDEVSYGFDNVTVGDLSPTLLERYVSAARKISRLAMGSTTRSPGGDTVMLPPDLTQEEHFDDLPLGTRGGLVVHYTFPQDAEYEINVRLARDRNEHVEGLFGPEEVELLLDGERLRLFTITPPAPGVDHHAVDQGLKIRVPVKAGPHEVAAAFPKRPSILLETERQPYQAHFNNDRHPRLHPAIYQISVNGPYDAKGPGDAPSRRRILICTPAKTSEEEACAGRIFSSLMRRAYRRPVTSADVAVPLRFFKEARKGGSFDDGIEMGLRSVLVSPEFLFRVEQDPAGVAPNTAYRVSNLELASRLSFFLWSSIPDDALLDAAISGKLKTPEGLAQQVNRMLADDRSKALVDNFAEQWLYLRNLASTNPDMRLFPDFDDNLRQAMRTETEMFFESILREDRNVLDLLRANYSFVNGRLAKHYGIPNIYGSRFRRVTFDKDSVRGGLLRQASILAVTSYATRTSPVIRGKWILANILGVPPPPPPAVVPALKENGGIGKTLSMRERMAEHRNNPACSGCHKLMDPIGFSFENYDAIGRWRTAEDGKPVDNSGGLPDGSTFEGVAGLQQALLHRPELFVGTLSEKLLTYALGRGVEYYDAPAIRKIVRESKVEDYRFSSVILGIVNSTPFQMRRSQ